jgi:hypothetical protein
LRYVALIFVAILTLSSVALIFVSYSDSIITNSSRFPSSKPVFAYYYGWYTKNAWYGGLDGPNSLAVADTPSIGLYDSQNITVIDSQISEALSAGIDGFIASWWGPGSYTDNSDQILLNQAAANFNDFSVTLYFETTIIQNMNTTNAQDSAQIVQDVSYIMKTYSSNPAFTEINGRPVLFFSGVDNWSVEFWANVTSAIHSSYPSLLLISDSLNLADLSVFNGAASYVDLGYMTQSLSLDDGTYPTFTNLSQIAQSEGKYWFATASPGFNGTNDDKTQFPVVARNEGDTFTLGWDIAQNSNPYGIIVGTWNEYYEGTSIEPAESYGDLYLELTSQLSTAWQAPAFPLHGFFFDGHLYPEELALKSASF